MTWSITGFAYLILSLVLGFVIWRIFYREMKDFVSKLWLYGFASFTLFVITRALSGLFFADNATILVLTIYSGVFFQTIGFAVFAYFLVYIIFQNRISPWLGALPTFILGFILTIATILDQAPQPVLQLNKAIDWGTPPNFPLSLLRFLLFFGVLLPVIFILIRQFKKAQDLSVKRKSLAFISLFVFAIVISLTDFIVILFFGLDPIWRDIILISCSLIFFLLFVPFYRLPDTGKNAKV